MSDQPQCDKPTLAQQRQAETLAKKRHLLKEIAGNQDAKITDLANEIGISRSYASRVTNGLI